MLSAGDTPVTLKHAGEVVGESSSLDVEVFVHLEGKAAEGRGETVLAYIVCARPLRRKWPPVCVGKMILEGRRNKG